MKWLVVSFALGLVLCLIQLCFLGCADSWRCPRRSPRQPNRLIWVRDPTWRSADQGTGHGTFGILRGIAFDDQNFLYVLDGSHYDKAAKALAGNLLIQKFDGTGKFVSQFSVRDEKLGDKDEPALLAIDANGDIYVTQPAAGAVQRYSETGNRSGV